MKGVKFIVVVVLSMVALASCKKDDSASLTLNKTSLYFASWSDSPQTISYVASNATSVAVGSISDGWNATVSMASRKIVVMPVGSLDEEMSNDELPKVGSVVINAMNKEGKSTSYYINLYICETIAIDEQGAANCYVVSTPSTSYTFDAMHRPDGSELATKKVKLLWQSNSNVVKNVALVDGRANFYVVASEADETRLSDTNAVIAAYNSAGDIIWSWHLWIVNENPLTDYDTYSNGKSFMRKNLGAFVNSNGATEEQTILDSYGLYYQWGRKDPFARPYYFNAASADIEGGFTEDGAYITESYKECTTAIGSVEYAIKNPLCFITNAACVEEDGDGIGDWLATTDNTLWSDTSKSLYDPCPAGWRVPTAEDMSVLKLAETEDNTPLATARKQFGWHLSDDNGNKYFYSACGRRRYSDGKVENINYKEGVYPSQPEPWEGHYWTSSTAADGKAVSLYFDLTTTRAINKFDVTYADRKANGFQIRCVKIE